MIVYYVSIIIFFYTFSLLGMHISTTIKVYDFCLMINVISVISLVYIIARYDIYDKKPFDASRTRKRTDIINDETEI